VSRAFSWDDGVLHRRRMGTSRNNKLLYYGHIFGFQTESVNAGTRRSTQVPCPQPARTRINVAGRAVETMRKDASPAGDHAGCRVYSEEI
jgi:hypothetical protein